MDDPARTVVSIEAIGIDVGATNVRAARVIDGGEVQASFAERVQPDRSGFVEQLRRLLTTLDPDGRRAVGIGLPGRIDAVARRPVTAGMLDIAGLMLVDAVAEGRPVYLENDATMALRAEMAIGAARGEANVAMITVGTGIGGACAMGGRLERGRAFAGQFGHVAFDASAGIRCACGRRGCLETMASGSALGRLISEAGFSPGTRASDLLRDAASGDGPASRVITLWGSAIRSGVETLMAAFDPDVVIVGGGLGRDAVAALAFAPASSTWFQTPVRAALLGDGAGVVGAGLHALAGGGQLVQEDDRP